MKSIQYNKIIFIIHTGNMRDVKGNIRMRKTILAFMTAVLLAGNSNAVYASGIPDVEVMETFETEALATEGESEASALPEEYTSPYVTSIKRQSPYLLGICGHGSIRIQYLEEGISGWKR